MKIFLWQLTNMFQGDSKTSQFSSYFPKCDVSVVQARAFAHLPRSTLQNILVPVTHHHHRLINCYDSFQPSWICTTAKQILHEICLQVSDQTLVKDYTGQTLSITVILTRVYALTLISALPGNLSGTKKLTLTYLNKR